MESEDATETEALLSAAEQGQAGVGKFFYFSTFVQAALIVHELHLLDLTSLRQVAVVFFFLLLSMLCSIHPFSSSPTMFSQVDALWVNRLKDCLCTVHWLHYMFGFSKLIIMTGSLLGVVSWAVSALCYAYTA